MARTVAVIQQAIIATLVTSAASVGVTIVPAQWSNFDYRQLITFVVAGAQAVHEQLWDAYQAVIEALIAKAPPQTYAWIQAQMLAFQFDATTPQIIQFDTAAGGSFAPYYPTVDASKRVIKYCSVVPGALGTTIIKVAAQVGGAPADLDTAFPGALDAAQSLANLICIPGIIYYVLSGNSDKLYVAATIYYQGGYSAVIQSTVNAAISNFLGALPFNGVMILSKLKDAITAVPGVNDVVFTNVRARPDTIAYPGGTVLVTGTDGLAPIGTEIQRKWQTYAGYCVAETTSGHTLTDSLTYVAE